jgi:hypothetical protein
VTVVKPSYAASHRVIATSSTGNSDFPKVEFVLRLRRRGGARAVLAGCVPSVPSLNDVDNRQSSAAPRCCCRTLCESKIAPLNRQDPPQLRGQAIRRRASEEGGGSKSARAIGARRRGRGSKLAAGYRQRISLTRRPRTRVKSWLAVLSSRRIESFMVAASTCPLKRARLKTGGVSASRSGPGKNAW